LWVKGRLDIFNHIKKDLKKNNAKTVWMHCASLGEFEQGKPVLEKILNHYPDIRPVISFFSPSGYEVIKKKGIYPHVYYLPMDSAIHAQKWMKLIDPSMVIWVKYEYWYYYLMAIRHRNIPLFMVSGIYRRDQPFFKWYGSLYRKMLTAFTHFFVQNESSKKYLSTLTDRNKITVSGDTRCDRVIEIAQNFEPIPEIEFFCNGNQAIVCGSTWEADEAIWTHFVKSNPDKKFIMAPHEIDQENIEHVQKEFHGILFSEWKKKLDTDTAATPGTNCLIVDNIGMLARLYHYASITYIGGGFGADGLHNILEAAVYGKPVLFGPAIYKNFEAIELIKAGAAQVVSNALELENTLDEFYKNPEKVLLKGRAAKNYVYANAGASEKILRHIITHDLL